MGCHFCTAKPYNPKCQWMPTCQICMAEVKPKHISGSALCRWCRFSWIHDTMIGYRAKTEDAVYAILKKELAEYTLTQEEKAFFVCVMVEPKGTRTCPRPVLYADLPIHLTEEDGHADIKAAARK